MDCKVFRKRLTDLLEDNISYDLKDAMLEHIESCKACKALYDEEVFIDETFKSSLSIEPHSFRSLRVDIMKNIDKNRYGKSPVKKLLYHIKKHRKAYVTAAAFIAFAVLITPYAIKNGFGLSANKNISIESTNNDATGSVPMQKFSASIAKGEENQSIQSQNAAKEDNTSTEMSIADSKAGVKNEISYMPEFKKKALDKKFKLEFNTPWESSPNKKYSATVEGKGGNAQEEGIAKLIIKDLSTGEQWSFELINNEEKQFTPKVVKWMDDKHLLVIIGYGYGMVDKGGELYVLNIIDSSIYKADPNNTAKLEKNSQVTKIVSVKELPSKDLEINVEVLVFDDDNLNTSHTENRTIVLSPTIYK